MIEKTIFRLPVALKPHGSKMLVRIGNRFDGGYILAADAVATMQNILTFGLGLDWSFEKGMVALGNIASVHCYDHTVTLAYLRSKYYRAIISYPLKPHKYGPRISTIRDYHVFFRRNANIKHFELALSGTDGTGRATVSEAVAKMGAVQDLMLKCDIEGAEYEISSDIISHRAAFDCIALEFHDVDTRLDEVLAMLSGLADTHQIDHVHVNNMSKRNEAGIPSVIEISLSKKAFRLDATLEALRTKNYRLELNGSLLDTPNAPDRPDTSIEYF